MPLEVLVRFGRWDEILAGDSRLSRPQSTSRFRF
jgi:hypothetical protein